MFLPMNENNILVREKRIIVQGLSLIFLSLIIFNAWTIFSSATSKYNDPFIQKIIGTETHLAPDGGIVTNYQYQDIPWLPIMTLLSLSIVLTPVIVTTFVMGYYVYTLPPKLIVLLKSFLFLLWLGATFYILSAILAIIFAINTNELWAEITLVYLFSASTITVTATVVIFIISLTKKRKNITSTIETYVQ